MVTMAIPVAVAVAVPVGVFVVPGAAEGSTGDSVFVGSTGTAAYILSHAVHCQLTYSIVLVDVSFIATGKKVVN